MQFSATPAQATILGQVPVIAQDQFAVAFQQSVPSDYPNIHTGGSTPIIDSSKYQSVILAINSDGLNADFPLTFDVGISWYGAGATYILTAVDTVTVRTPFGGQGFGPGSTPTIVKLPCKGSSFQLSVGPVAAAGADATLNVVAYGSYRQLTPGYTTTNDLEWGTSGSGGVLGGVGDTHLRWNPDPLAAGVTVSEIPPMRAGPATLLVDIIAATGTPGCVIQVNRGSATWVDICGTRAVATVGKVIQNVVIPMLPIRFLATAPAASSLTVVFDLMMENQ